ncbi:MAG: hypothetical protein QOF76_636, partial [Solirubrobacteraceae bacterium]|nr:hypothetical protein [Solirubrobacteraceae bacterium]
MATWNERAFEGLRQPELGAFRDLPGVWVVGGAVRDVLLGSEPREFDVVVEGDAAALARKIGAPILHERFGTAKVGHVDIASARTETYPEPGALPEVRLGAAMRDDLARRDFTVNTFAVRLSDGFGLCWPGAEDDLERGVLRVLHDDSFTDDPTRVLRMVRYAARLGFAPEPHTAALAASARFSTVSGERVGAELRLALAEPLPEVLLALNNDDLGKRAVHPAFGADRAFLEQVLREVPAGAVPGLAALGACLLDAPDVPGALHRLGFPAAERAIVSAVAGGSRPLAQGLLAAGTPSAV